MCFSCPPSATPTACFCSDCYSEPLEIEKTFIGRIIALPIELFSNVLAFDRKAYLVFQLIAKKTNQKVIELLKSSQDGIIRGASKGGTPLYRDISTILPNRQTHIFHEMIYKYASMYGGKWNVQYPGGIWRVGCPIFASAEEICQINNDIQKKKNEHLMNVWDRLRPTIELTQNVGPDFPGSEDSPEVILRWMEQNQKLCFGITLQSLPLVGIKMGLLRLYLENLANTTYARERPIVHPTTTIVSHMIPDFRQTPLSSRLAEDLDRLLRFQKIDLEGNTMPIVNKALRALSRFLQEKGVEYQHTSINIYCTRNATHNLKYQAEVFHGDDITATEDPPATVHFYVSKGVEESHYFDEKEVRIRLVESLEHQLASMNIPEQERPEYQSWINAALGFLRGSRLTYVRNNLVPPSYFVLHFEVVRSADGSPPGLLVRTDVSDINLDRQLAPVLKFPVTLRLHYSDTRDRGF